MPTTLLDLPFDILLDIIPYLDASNFLHLTSTCKALNDEVIRYSPAFWRHATQSKFRVRNRLAAQRDGIHWQRLYRRLLTQSRVFTWGQDTYGCLGRDRDADPSPDLHAQVPPRLRRGHLPFGPGDRRRGLVGRPVGAIMETDRPGEMADTRTFGTIADLQCGGWSTSVLNDKGTVYTVGVIDAASNVPLPREGGLKPLKFPPGYPQAGERYEPATAIRSFSSGRSHILGLSDSGAIWSWYDAETPCVHIRFEGIRTLGDADKGRSGHGYVRDVVAGWDKSAAYITGSGIVLWDVIRRRRVHDGEAEMDTLILEQHQTVPRTDYVRPRGHEREVDQESADLGKEIGEVTSFILLEGFVVFATDIGKVFAARSRHDRATGIMFDSCELIEFSITAEGGEASAATDVQGSFRRFAVFKSNGAVLVGNTDYLNARIHQSFGLDTSDIPEPTLIPALQNTGVIQMAFGDYHFHALHSDGHITSYGYEPQSCGALGLGTFPSELRSNPRGLHNSQAWAGSDSLLTPHAYITGRRVWFQPEKRTWLTTLIGNTVSKSDAEAVISRLSRDRSALGELGDWVEEHSKDWDRRPEVKDHNADDLGAHYALSVAAAGWHSGALVLVNEQLQEAVRRNCRDVSTSIGESSSSLTGLQPPVQSTGTLVSSIVSGVQRFLGLSNADPSLDVQTGDQNQWTWEDDSLPRLQLSDGEELPGSEPVSDWESPHKQWASRLKYESGNSTDVFGIKGWRLE